MRITNVQTVIQNRLFHIHAPKLAQKEEKSAKLNFQHDTFKMRMRDEEKLQELGGQ